MQVGSREDGLSAISRLLHNAERHLVKNGDYVRALRALSQEWR